MKEKKTFIKCDHCGVDVIDINLGDHNSRVHGIGDSSQKKNKNKTRSLSSKERASDKLFPITKKTFHDFIQIRLKEGKASNEAEARKIVEQACDDYNKSAQALLTGIPTAGALARFEYTHHDLLEYSFKKLNVGAEIKKLAALRDSIKSETDHELDRIEKTMTLEDGLMELEKKENALSMQFELINRKKPGFEEYLVDLFFFKGHCINCPFDELKANDCQNGSTFCVYDEEFLRFELEYTRKIIIKIKNGEYEIEELKVPEKYVRRKKELQLACDRDEEE